MWFCWIAGTRALLQFNRPVRKNAMFLSRKHTLPVAALALLLLSIKAGGCQRMGQEKPVVQEPVLDPEVAGRVGVAEIKKLGGRIQVDDQNPKAVAAVHLPTTPITDADLACLAKWTDLRLIDLSGTKISDAGLEHLQGLTRLQTLYLPFTRIKGEGLKFLSKLTQLQVLDLNKTPISDAALKHLQNFSKLQILSLNETGISDAGLIHLQGLTSLDRLDLSSTQVTDAGVKELKAALPKCEIRK